MSVINKTLGCWDLPQLRRTCQSTQNPELWEQEVLASNKKNPFRPNPGFLQTHGPSGSALNRAIVRNRRAAGPRLAPKRAPPGAARARGFSRAQSPQESAGPNFPGSAKRGFWFKQKQSWRQTWGIRKQKPQFCWWCLCFLAGKHVPGWANEHIEIHGPLWWLVSNTMNGLSLTKVGDTFSLLRTQSLLPCWEVLEGKPKGHQLFLLRGIIPYLRQHPCIIWIVTLVKLERPSKEQMTVEVPFNHRPKQSNDPGGTLWANKQDFDATEQRRWAFPASAPNVCVCLQTRRTPNSRCSSWFPLYPHKAHTHTMSNCNQLWNSGNTVH